MGIASVVLGILAILISWIPCLWPIVAGHVLLGTGLGVADVVGKKKEAAQRAEGDEQIRQSRVGVGIAGICLNLVAVVLMIVWRFFWQTEGFGSFGDGLPWE